MTVAGSSHGSAERLDAAAGSATGIVAWYAQGFADRLGDRLLLFDNTGAPPLELLRLAQRLTQDPAFEPALRERVEGLKPFRHPAFARVRGLSVLAEPTPQLALVSEHIPGQRLSEILHAARHAGFKPDPGTALWLVRQLLPAVAALHEMGAEIAHGALSPDRIIVTPTGDLVVAEYVFAHALDRLDAEPGDLWRDLGVAVSQSARRLDQRGDIEQVGLLALAVLLGRPLGTNEYPGSVRRLLEEACDPNRWSLVPPLRTWLTRALALDSKPFATASAALDTLDQLLPRVSGMWAPRLLPQNLASTLPPAGARLPTNEAAPSLPPADETAAAPVREPKAAPSAQNASRPVAGTETRSPAANRPDPVPPIRRDDRPPMAKPAVAVGTAKAPVQVPTVLSGTSLDQAETVRRLWMLCAGLATIALLEALCLVLLLTSR